MRRSGCGERRAHRSPRGLARDHPGPARSGAAMVQLRERVRLVHELGELAPPKKLLHGGHDRRMLINALGGASSGSVIVMRSADAFHGRRPNAGMLLDELAHRSHAAVAEVVDVIVVARPLLILTCSRDDAHEVVRPQPALVSSAHRAPGARSPCAANAAEVVTAGLEEQRLQQVAGVVVRRRVARANLAIELEQGAVLVFASVPRAPC